MVSHERIRFPEWLESPKSIKTFRARLAYTSKWLVDARRRKGCEPARLDMKKFVWLPSAEKIGW
ncbi:hypothetical protein AA987_05445 [Enterococcus cecorum]|nr:hypothetical protein AA987_05445 [Enterococcus cecorum]